MYINIKGQELGFTQSRNGLAQVFPRAIEIGKKYLAVAGEFLGHVKFFGRAEDAGEVEETFLLLFNRPSSPEGWENLIPTVRFGYMDNVQVIQATSSIIALSEGSEEEDEDENEESSWLTIGSVEERGNKEGNEMFYMAKWIAKEGLDVDSSSWYYFQPHNYPTSYSARIVGEFLL